MGKQRRDKQVTLDAYRAATEETTEQPVVVRSAGSIDDVDDNRNRGDGDCSVGLEEDVNEDAAAATAAPTATTAVDSQQVAHATQDSTASSKKERTHKLLDRNDSPKFLGGRTKDGSIAMWILQYMQKGPTTVEVSAKGDFPRRRMIRKTTRGIVVS